MCVSHHVQTLGCNISSLGLLENKKKSKGWNRSSEQELTFKLGIHSALKQFRTWKHWERVKFVSTDCSAGVATVCLKAQSFFWSQFRSLPVVSVKTAQQSVKSSMRLGFYTFPLVTSRKTWKKKLTDPLLYWHKVWLLSFQCTQNKSHL